MKIVVWAAKWLEYSNNYNCKQPIKLVHRKDFPKYRNGIGQGDYNK